MNDFSVLPSALAYLFGDVLESEFAGKTRLGFSEKLPCREIKIKKKDLATMMVVAGLSFLRKAGHLQQEKVCARDISQLRCRLWRRPGIATPGPCEWQAEER